MKDEFVIYKNSLLQNSVNLTKTCPINKALFGSLVLGIKKTLFSPKDKYPTITKSLKITRLNRWFVPYPVNLAASKSSCK